MTDIKFHADMNFNMLRCWGGGLAERPDFYHFCDVYGLMVSLSLSTCKLVVMFSYPNYEFWVVMKMPKTKSKQCQPIVTLGFCKISVTSWFLGFSLPVRD
jgi:hypothetical protein